MNEGSISIKGMTLTIRLNTFDHGILHEVIERDEYKLREMAGLGVRPKLIVDIGGHIGGFGAAAAQMWPAATVLSFEAYQPNYELLARNLAQFPNARAVHAAVVGDSSITEAKFLCSDQSFNTGGGGLNTSGNVVVPACGVDRVLQMALPHQIDLLKLDCEGSEEEILLAFEKLDMIKNLGVVCGEWHGISRSDALKKILSPTHTFNSVPHPNPSVLDLGLFFATPSVVCL